ncbi:hypothetical protein LCGC14_1619240 [marine sediment metagenome]|uniref:Uncharacterized protein n=1 Tax=marine sediment metagenome TaxID=412755 RepID=A0A0F9L607_9ZZZZ
MEKKLKLKEGEWAYLKTRGHRLICCDCGLEHKMDFLVVNESTGHVLNGVEIVFRAYRMNKKKKTK